jgi:hypothetical protein
LRLTARGTVEKYTLSLAIDERAGTVTVQNYGPVPILGKSDLGNTVSFMADKGAEARRPDKWVSMGSINRLTGALYISFITDNDGVHIFQGRCRPAEKLF